MLKLRCSNAITRSVLRHDESARQRESGAECYRGRVRWSDGVVRSCNRLKCSLWSAILKLADKEPRVPTGLSLAKQNALLG